MLPYVVNCSKWILTDFSLSAKEQIPQFIELTSNHYWKPTLTGLQEDRKNEIKTCIVKLSGYTGKF